MSKYRTRAKIMRDILYSLSLYGPMNKRKLMTKANLCYTNDYPCIELLEKKELIKIELESTKYRRNYYHRLSITEAGHKYLNSNSEVLV